MLQRCCALRDPPGRAECQGKGNGQGKRYFVDITSDSLALRKLNKLLEITADGRTERALLRHFLKWERKKLARFSVDWYTDSSKEVGSV